MAESHPSTSQGLTADKVSPSPVTYINAQEAQDGEKIAGNPNTLYGFLAFNDTSHQLVPRDYPQKSYLWAGQRRAGLGLGVPLPNGLGGTTFAVREAIAVLYCTPPPAKYHGITTYCSSRLCMLALALTPDPNPSPLTPLQTPPFPSWCLHRAIHRAHPKETPPSSLSRPPPAEPPLAARPHPLIPPPIITVPDSEKGSGDDKVLIHVPMAEIAGPLNYINMNTTSGKATDERKVDPSDFWGTTALLVFAPSREVSSGGGYGLGLGVEGWGRGLRVGVRTVRSRWTYSPSMNGWVV